MPFILGNEFADKIAKEGLSVVQKYKIKSLSPRFSYTVCLQNTII